MQLMAQTQSALEGKISWQAAAADWSSAAQHNTSADYDDRQIESALQHLYGVDTQLVRDGTYHIVEWQHDVVGCGGWSRRLTPFGGDNAGTIRNAGLRRPGPDSC